MGNSQSGKNKAYQVSYTQISELDEECRQVKLTRQQIFALMVQSAYLGWSTRWDGAPPTFKFDEFQAATQAALMNDCDCWDCDDVADCIETSENVRNALLRLVNNSQDAPGSPQTPQSANEDRAAGLNPTCDQDTLFGQCLAVVDMVHTSITDILELIEAQNNFIEVANVVANLPGLDELGIDALTEAVDLLFEAIGESYQAQYTIERRLTLACDIYCQCKSDCQISTERVWAGYQAAVARDFPNPFSFDTFLAVLDFLVDAEIDQANVVTAMHAMFWGGVRLISEMIGVGSIDRVMRLALAFAEPNNLWVDCECPDTWEYEFDFSLSDGGWFARDDAPPGLQVGAWVDGAWRDTVFVFGGQQGRGIDIAFDLGASANITRMEITGTVTPGSPGYAANYLVINPPGEVYGPGVPIGSAPNYPANMDLSGTRIVVDIQLSYPGNTGSVEIQKLKVFGIGAKPPNIP